MNNPPAFQLYPDKALAGTVHLSPIAFKAYWMVLWWMWLHSRTQCTMPDTDAAWIRATLIHDKEVLQAVRDEIMDPSMPLLKRNHETLISVGLKKEASKYAERRSKAKKGAKARWDKELGNKEEDAPSIGQASSKQCLPTPTPTVYIDLVKESKPKKVRGSSKFVPPTVLEVQAYITEKGFHFDANQFINYYEAEGWTTNEGKPVKSWKRCCITWEKNYLAKHDTEYESPYHRQVAEKHQHIVDAGVMEWIDRSRAVARHLDDHSTWVPARDSGQEYDKGSEHKLVMRVQNG